MKIKIQAHLFGVKLSLGVTPTKHAKKTPASRTELKLVEQAVADLETFVIEQLAEQPPVVEKEPTRLGFGFTTVSEEDLDSEETADEWFDDEDEEEDEDDWEED